MCLIPRPQINGIHLRMRLADNFLPCTVQISRIPPCIYVYDKYVLDHVLASLVRLDKTAASSIGGSPNITLKKNSKLFCSSSVRHSLLNLLVDDSGLSADTSFDMEHNMLALSLQSVYLPLMFTHHSLVTWY